MAAQQPQRIGVFGGTFDPVHLGHVICAEQCREQARLDQVWFVPAARPPHKLDRAVTPFDKRVEMLQLALAGYPAFHVDLLERDRPGPSFTSDTLAELHRLHPATEFFLLIGSDMLPDLPHWHQPERVVEQATLLIVVRPDAPLLSTDQLRTLLKLPSTAPPRWQIINMPVIGIASSDLRQRLAEGRSVRYLVPRAVESYIADKHLYVESTPASG
jgi:nicotinate-nucleotide adenylyltransferase